MARLIVAISAGLLIGYASVWVSVSPQSAGRSDFTSTYVGATLFRDGFGSRIYDPALQTQVHSRVIAPDRTGNLPFVDAPLAAVVAAPVTFLPLDAAYRAWGIFELLTLIAAVIIAVRSARWPKESWTIWKVAAALAALAALGTVSLLMEAQWTGVNALGLALAYRDWRHGKTGRGAVWLILFAGVAKPHLALGLVAFALGWRERRVVQGAVVGAIAVTALSVAAVGFSGVAGFVSLVGQSSTQFSPNSFVGLYGLFGTVLGPGAPAELLWLAGAVAGCVLAWLAGAAVRRDRTRLEIGLTVATLVSILAAPHVYTHDMVLLAPMFVWAMADARVRDQASPLRTRRTTVTVMACWFALFAAELLSQAGGSLAAVLGGPIAAGAVVPEVLVALAVAGVVVTLRGSHDSDAPLPMALAAVSG
ncbi:MAG: glycosyltransferase family 87 protein [Candidatus Dormiibacterota bacterium]